MKDENKKIMLDRSQGTQLTSKEKNVKLYSVKEVCKMTGLTRKQLFDYQKMVKPAALDKSGYKLYDENSISRLSVIAEMRGINIPLAKIKEVLEGKGSKMSAIMNQINVLEEQKKQIDDMIVKARDMINTN